MKKILNVLFVFVTTLLLSGCVTPILLTGTAVGASYVKSDIEENYYGDSIEYIKDKTYSLTSDY